VLLLISSGIYAFLSVRQGTAGPSNATNNFGLVSLPQGTITSSSIVLDASRTLSVNGQLLANNGLVLTPSDQPTKTTSGLIYYDKNTNKPYYYDGTAFQALGGNVNSIGGATGNITIGGGLTIVNNQLSTTASGVTSFQGQTGDVTLQAGNGIDVTSTTVTNTGVLSVAGTTNQVNVSGATGNITLSLPQDIAVSSSPTFAGLAVSSLNSAGVVHNSAAGILSTGAVSLATEVTGTLAVGNGGTGSTTAAGARTNLGAAASGANADITSTSALNTITPSAALTVGAAGQALTLQGAAVTLVSNNGGFTTTVGFGGVPISNLVYNFDRAVSAGTYTICTTAGNCSGGGGGTVSSPGGTGNTLAKFSAAQSIVDSILTDNGTTVTVGGNLTVNNTLSTNTISPTATLTVGVTGQALTLQGNAATSISATSGVFTNTLVFATPAGSGKTITIPNATGTVAVSASGNIALDAAGNVTFTGLLPIASGGTNGSATPTAGAIAYGTGTAFAFNSAGASNQILTSAGAGTPTFQNLASLLTAGSNINITGTTNATIATVSNPSFSTSVTTPQLIFTGAGSNGTLQVASLGQPTAFTLPDPGAGSATICVSSGNCVGGGTGSAPAGAQYLTLALDGNLSAERVLTPGSSLTITDGGANGNYSINTIQDIRTSASPTFAATTLGSGALQGSLVLNDGSGRTGTIKAATQSVGNANFTLPDAAGANQTICTLQLANCLGGAGGGANTSLSNLSSVAINTALLPAGDNTIDLGSSANSFRTLYADTSVLTGLVDTAAAAALGIGTGTQNALTVGRSGASTTINGSAASSIAFTNFTVSAAGAIVGVGVNSGAGLLQGNGGVTVTGTTNLNASGAAATNVGTGTGNTAIGNLTGTLSLASNGGLNVTTAGAVTGVATLNASGLITGNGLAAGSGSITGTGGLTVTGTVNLNNTTAGATNIGTGTGNTAIGNATGTLSLASNGGLNVTTGGAVTGVSTLNASGLLTSVGINAGSGLIQGTGGLTIGGSVAYTKGTDYSTTGSQNNVNFGAGALIRLTGASAQTITGIAGGTDGRIITLVNAGANAATLSNNSASSIAANRITTGTGADLTIPADASVKLVYDSGASLWRVIGGVASSGGICTTCANTSLSNLSSVAINTALLTTGDNTIDLGSVANSFRTLYADTSVLTGSVDTAAAAALNLGTTTQNALTVGRSGASTTINGSAASAITFTNFSVSAAGAVVGVGVNSGSGLLQGTGGLTVTGAASINASGAAATNLGTGTGNTAIGNSTGTLSLASNGGLNVTTAGAVTGVTTLNASGLITGNGLAAGSGSITGTGGLTVTGTINLNNTTAGATNVGTGTGNTAIGNSTGTLSLASNGGLNVTTTGAVTGVSTLNASGLITSVGLNAGSGLIQGTGGLTIGGSEAFTKGADYSTVGSQNNVSFGAGALFRLTGASAQTITGISGGADGRIITLVNAGANAAILSNNSGSSIAANRITTGTGSDLTLPADASVKLVYDSGASLWRVIGGVASTGGICTTCANQQLSNLSGTVAINTALLTAGDNLIDLGSSANSFRTLYADTSVLTGSVDTAAAAALNLGTTTQNALTVGRSGASTTINGSAASAITFTNFSVSAAGAVVGVGVNSGSGLLQGTGGLTVTGAASINASGAAATNLGTGTGNTAIGNSTGTLSLASNGGLNVTTAGAVTGVTTLNASGLITGNGLTAGSGLIQGTGGLTIGSSVAFTKGTDYSTTGSQNNVNFGTGALIRLTGASAQTITGIAGGADGRIITLVNAGTNSAILSNLSGSSTAANQISTGTGADLTLPAGASVNLVYDSGASLWRVVGGVASSGGICSTCANQQLSNLSGTVAINTALLTAGDNLIDLGSSANSFRTLYADTSVLTGSVDTAAAAALNLGTTTQNALTVGRSGASTTINGSAASAITFTNFSVSAAGAVVGVGVNSGSGLLQGTGGLTVTGTANVNATTAGATNLGTGTGNTAIGNSTGTLSLASNGGLNVTTAGAVTGVTTLNASGLITGNGLAAGSGSITGTGGLTVTGTVNLNNTTAGATNVGTGTGNTAIGNSTGTLSLASNGGLNLTTGGAVTGVSTLNASGLITSVGLNAGSGLIQGTGGLTIGGSEAFTKGADYSTTGSQNNVSFGAGALFRLTGASTQTITGISGGADGRVITLVNAASQAAVLSNNSGSSTAANRITTGTGADLSIPADASVKLVYDSGASLWRVIGGVASSGGICTTCANQQLSNLSGTVAINTALLTAGDNLIDLGSSANSFRTLYADTSVLTGSVDTAAAAALNLGTGTQNALTVGRSGASTTINGSAASAITFTNFSVSAAGAVVGVGVNSGSGLLQGTGGLTVTGAASINASGAAATNLGTGTGNTAIGNSTGTLSLASNGGLNVTTAGAVTGVTTLNASGLITGNGLAAGSGSITGTGGLTVTGTVNLNNTTAGATNVGTGTGNTAIGNSTGTLSLASNGGLNVTTGGAVTGVSTLNASGLITSVGLNAGSGLIQGTGGLTLGGSSAYTKGADYSTVGSQNNVSFGAGTLFRLTGATAQTITGIAGGADGRVLTLVNAAANAATLSNLSGSSLAANQISTGTGADLSVPAGASVSLIYDSGASLWRVIGGVASSGGICSTCANQQLSNLSGTVAINTALLTAGDNLIDLGSVANSFRTLYADTSVLTGSVDTASAAALGIGTGTQNALTVGRSGASTTINGSAASAITFTNFSVSAAGAIVGVGVNSGSGLLQGTGGLTVTGAASINASGAGATNLGTGTGNVAIGNSTGTLSLASNGGLNVTTAGAVTGVTTLNASGLITGNGLASGAGAITGTGGLTLTGAIAVNNNGSSTIGLNTGSSTGQITLGGGSAPLVIDSTNFDVSSAGALSGITTLGLSGNLTQTSGATISAGTGFKINGGAAASGNYLRGDGTNFVSSAIQAGDVPSLTGTYLRNAPAATSDNTVAVSTSTIDDLTLNATNTSGTQANGLAFNRNGTGGTTTNALSVTNTLGTTSNGLQLTQSGGTFTTGINFTGTFGNLIVAPSFSVSNAGAIVGVGVNSGAGLLQGAGGLTLTGAIAVNNNSSNTIGLNTGTSTGQITLGGGSAPLVIDSTNFDVSSAGALSGITTIATSSTINSQTISNAASFTGTVTVATGYQIGGGAASGNYLRGNGTNFVSSAILAADIPAGSANYIQNQSSLQTTSNFHISGTGTADTSFSTPTITTASGDLTIDPTGNTIINGSVSTNASAALNVQNSSAASILFARNDGNVGINSTAPQARLEVVGNIVSAGTEWTARTTPADNQWFAVTYGNGMFVSIAGSGTNNRVMTSQDGVNWTTRTSAADNGWHGITYGNGLFVAVAGSGTGTRVMTSPDGITWTLRASAADNQWRSVAYGNGLFVAVSNDGTGNRVMTSPDGIIWTSRVSAVDNGWEGLTYGPANTSTGGLFVAVAPSGTANRVMTSPDGTTWTAQSTSGFDNAWFQVTYGNGLFVAVACGVNDTVCDTTAGNRVMTSPDGVTWTTRTTPADIAWASIAYGNGLFVAVASSSGSGNKVMTSVDGINWVTRASAADNDWRGVTYGNGLFVAVACGSGTSCNATAASRVMTSGIQALSVAPTNNIYQGGLSVAGGNVSIGNDGGFADVPSRLPYPATVPGGNGNGAAFSPDGVYMSIASTTTPFINIYKRSGDNFTKLADPATLPGSAARSVSFSPDNVYMSVTTDSTPFVTIYKRSGDTFTKLTDPATLPASNGRAVSWSPGSLYMAVAHDTSPFVTIYKRSGDTFTKLTNPATLPAGNGRGASFSPDGQYLSISHSTSPFVTIYKRSGDTFTKLADPATLPPNSGQGTSFSSDGVYLAVTNSTTSPFLTIYKRSGDTFIKLTGGAASNGTDTALPNTGTQPSFSPDGQYLAVGHSTTPFITIFKRTGDVFNKIADPTSLPPSTSNSVAFSPDSQYLADAHDGTNSVEIYKGGNGAATRLELTSSTSAADGLAFGKELQLYRSAPGILSLAAGGSLGIESGNLYVQGGSLAVGSNTAGRTLDVTGSVGGNVVTTTTADSTTTSTITTPALAYFVQSSDTTGACTTGTKTFNITGVPDYEGTFIYIVSKAVDAGCNSGSLVVTVQINGNTIGTVTNAAAAASTVTENYTVAYINGAWRIVGLNSGTAQAATGSDTADLAEWIASTGTMPEAGDILTTGDAPVSAKQSSTAYDPKLLGVVSTNPHTTMGTETPTSVKLALAGRVPVKVSTSNGPIVAGDSITSSTEAGVGMKATAAGRVIGVALEDYSAPGVGSITVLVNPSFYSPPADSGSVQGQGSFQTLDVLGAATIGNLNVSGQTTLASLTVTGNAHITGDLHVAGTTYTADIIINGHIVTGNKAGTTTVAANPAVCGTGCTLTIAGNDTSGVITVNTGTGVTAGDLGTVTFAGAYSFAPQIALTPQAVPAASVFPQYYAASTTTTFDLSSYNAISASKTYKFTYQVLQ
jgi:hypothetical protein